MNSLTIGIDIGGTNIAAGLVTDSGALLACESVPTPRGAAAVTDAAVHCAQLALDSAGMPPECVASVGVGVPGTVWPRGVVSFACNIGLRDVPLAAMLESRFRRPVYLENDGSCAAVGEYLAGSGMGRSSLLCVVIGTGVGGGYIENGRLFRGSNGCGGEFGHMVIVPGGRRCACSRLGCFEKYASASALAGMAADYARSCPDSLCAQLISRRGRADGRTIFDAMDGGDPGAGAVFDEYIRYLGCGITNLVNIFQPEVLCLGGGISAQGERLTGPLRGIVAAEEYARDCAQRVSVVPAALGGRAGVVGAALLEKFISGEKCNGN